MLLQGAVWEPGKLVTQLLFGAFFTVQEEYSPEG